MGKSFREGRAIGPPCWEVLVMSVFICPPPARPSLHPEHLVPHPGFGYTLLERNGRVVWRDIDGDWFDENGEDFTVADLTEWCPVRQGVGWKLTVYGPMQIEVYRLRDGVWQLTETRLGFA